MNYTYIKLLIGAVLFGTLVALTVLHVPGDERLVDLIYGALIGMGIMHIGSRGEAPPVADKQSGFASVGMLLTTALCSALVLAGCATTAPQQVQVTFAQSCAGYSAAFATVTELRAAGKLNADQIDQVTLLSHQITPICTGPAPADTVAATQTITAAVTSLVIIEGIKK